MLPAPTNVGVLSGPRFVGPPPPDPPAPGPGLPTLPLPPPAEVIDENIEFEPFVAALVGVQGEPPVPPAPTVIGKPVAVTGTPVVALKGDPV